MISHITEQYIHMWNFSWALKEQDMFLEHYSCDRKYQIFFRKYQTISFVTKLEYAQYKIITSVSRWKN